MKQRKCRFLHSWIIHLKQRNFLGIRYYPALFKISTVLIIICTVYPIITFCLTKEGTAGTFGDQYGFINALISGMAFAAFWCSLQLQHRELKLQRKELSRANKEAKDQTEQFEEQTKQLREQLELARSSQIKDEIYRRIDYVKKLEASCCLITEEKVQSNSEITHPVSHKGLEAIDIIVTNIEKIINWDDKQIETFATNNTFTNGSINAWLKSCIHLSNFIYRESKLNEEEKLYYLDFFISSIPAPAANLMYLWLNLIQIPGSNETIEYLIKHRLINPPLAYREQTFQRKFQRCIEINNQ